jgi:hypothetical protein
VRVRLQCQGAAKQQILRLRWQEKADPDRPRQEVLLSLRSGRPTRRVGLAGPLRDSHPPPEHHRHPTAGAWRPMAAAGAKSPSGEPPRGTGCLEASAGSADRGLPRGGDPAGRVSKTPPGSGAKGRSIGGSAAATAGAGRPAHGTSWRGEFHRGFLRSGARWTG